MRNLSEKVFVRREREFAHPLPQYAGTDPFGVDVFEWCAKDARWRLVGCMYTETARAIHGNCAFVAREKIGSN